MMYTALAPGKELLALKEDQHQCPMIGGIYSFTSDQCAPLKKIIKEDAQCMFDRLLWSV